MFSLLKKKTVEEPKLETCISCNMPIHDNPHFEIFLKDIIEGKIFSVYTHNSVDHQDCFSMTDIMNKFKYAKFLSTGIKYTLEKPKKK